MITELSILRIDPEHSKDFEKMHNDVLGVLRRQPGHISDKLFSTDEVAGQYVLMVEWESVADHKNFIASSEYPLMAEPYGKFVKDSSFAHYTTVAES